MSERLHVEAKGFEEAAKRFQNLPGIVAKAERRALKRASDFARSQGAKAMSRESKITQAKLKKGRRALVALNNHEANVFFGTNPVKASYVGAPRQQARGARVGQHTFKGAFVAAMKSGHVGIFKRMGKDRLPIVEQELPVSLLPADFQRVGVDAEARFLNEFGSNLEFYAGLRTGV